jgi:hypothetical protein
MNHDALESDYQTMLDAAMAKRFDGDDLLFGDYYRQRNTLDDALDSPIDSKEVYLFPTYKAPKQGKRMRGRKGGKTPEEKKLYAMELREYMRQMYINLGLNEQRGIPPYLTADDLQRLETYNRRSRANRLAGEGHMQNIPIDVYTWLWKNSVILVNLRHVFMMTRKDISHAMKIEVSSIQKAMVALEAIGLIKRVGKCKRGNNAYNIVYEFKDLDEFFREQSIKMPPNYKIRERISDIIWNTDIKQGRKKKDVEQANRNRRALIANNPYWGLFTDVVE